MQFSYYDNALRLGFMPRRNILALLQGGDRRSIGRSDHVAAAVSRSSTLFPELIAGLWHEDPLVRMRAADAAEKVTRKSQKLLHPYKKELLGLLNNAEEPELRWHLAAMIPRLELDGGERKAAASALERYLEDSSSIVKTFALQGLADLGAVGPTNSSPGDPASTPGCAQRHAGNESPQPQIVAAFGKSVSGENVLAADASR